MKTTRKLLKDVPKLLKALEKTAGGRPAGAMGPLKYAPPKAVQRNAELGLALRIYNEEVRGLKRPGGTEIGVARAVQLVSGKPITPRAAKRMVSFFRRHETYKQTEGWGDPDEPTPSFVSWLLWGGDEGWAWTKSLVARMKKG